MKVTEEALLKSGFSPADVEKINNNVKSYGGTPDSVIHDLANRFNISKWITIVAFFILFIALIFSSKNNILSLLFALIVGLPFIWYLTPARLAFKAWQYKKCI